MVASRRKSKRAEFLCPKCDTTRYLEVVCSGAIITQELESVGLDGYFEVTGYTEVHEVDTHRFQCKACGYVVASNLNEYNDWVEKTFDTSELWG